MIFQAFILPSSLLLSFLSFFPLLFSFLYKSILQVVAVRSSICLWLPNHSPHLVTQEFPKKRFFRLKTLTISILFASPFLKWYSCINDLKITNSAPGFILEMLATTSTALALGSLLSYGPMFVHSKDHDLGFVCKPLLPFVSILVSCVWDLVQMQQAQGGLS